MAVPRVCVCLFVYSLLPPRASTLRNIGAYVFTATQKTLYIAWPSEARRPGRLTFPDFLVLLGSHRTSDEAWSYLGLARAVAHSYERERSYESRFLIIEKSVPKKFPALRAETLSAAARPLSSRPSSAPPLMSFLRPYIDIIIVILAENASFRSYGRRNLLASNATNCS